MKCRFELPSNVTLEDLLIDLAMKGWLVARDSLDSTKLTHDNYLRFAEEIRSVFMEHLSPEGAPQESRKFILQVQGRIEDFIRELTFRAFCAIVDCMKPGTEYDVNRLLHGMFGAHVRSYIHSPVLYGKGWDATEVEATAAG